MANVTLYYKTIKQYYCVACDEVIPINHYIVQDDTLSRANFKDVDYVCMACSETNRITLKYITFSIYAPPPPPFIILDAYGFGSNVDGSLGDNTTTQRDDPIQVLDVGGIGFLEDLIFICGGGFNVTDIHTLAIGRDNKVYSWGSGNSGQLGENNNIDRHVPVQVLGVAGVGFIAAVKVAGGGIHSLFLDEHGFVYACGSDGFGQCGDGVAGAQNNALVQVVDNPGTGFLTDIIDIDAGYQHSIACDSSGHVWCWGSNAKGQLGRGAPLGTFPKPQQVLGVGGVGVLENIIAVAANFETSYALDTSGNVWAWGYNAFDQLGNNNTGVNQNYPVQVHGLGDIGFLGNVVRMSAPAGGYHIFALLNDDTVVAWGYGNTGQLGGGDFNSNPYPDYVLDSSGIAPIPAIIDIATGTSHSIVCDGSNNMWICGRAAEGQLGQGSPPPANQWLPVQVHGVGDIGFLTDVVKVGGGFSTSFALRS